MIDKFGLKKNPLYICLINGPVAQGIEQLPSKQLVEGSNPSRITKFLNYNNMEKEKTITLELPISEIESLGIMVHFWLTTLKTELQLATSENDMGMVDELLEDVMFANKIYKSIHKDVEPVLDPVFEG